MNLYKGLGLTDYIGPRRGAVNLSVFSVDPLRLEDGHLVVPEGPGLGIELNESAIAKYPFNDKVLETPIARDGSVSKSLADRAAELPWCHPSNLIRPVFPQPSQRLGPLLSSPR